MRKYIYMILALSLTFPAIMHAGEDKTLSDALRGTYPGLRVTSLDGSMEGGFNVHVRGVNSIRSSAQPLYVIDGVYVSGSQNETLNSLWKAGEGYRMSEKNPFLFLNMNDIESIEVLRNVSATALYGSEGANGVILITTRNAGDGDRMSIDWNSSASLVTPTVGSDRFGTYVAHDHNVSVGMSKGGVRYYLSGWWRNSRGAVSPSDASYGGLRLNFETNANRFIGFGLNASIALGNVSSIGGVAWAGDPSYSVSALNPSIHPQDTPEGWIRDFDDDVEDRRALVSAWIRVNFLKTLSWKTTFGVDFQNNVRYVWYGRSTSYGLAKNGAASILNNNVLRYRVNSALTFNRYFSEHHLNVSGGYEAGGLWLKSNTMNGADFFNHDLRAKGLSMGAAKSSIFEIDNNHDRQAVFATLSYDWNGIIGADGIFRAEFLPRFHDWNPSLYPSGELWADLHKAFMPDFRPVSTVRLSAGYGMAGYDRSMAYETVHKWVPGALADVPAGAENYFKALNVLTTSELHAGINLGFLSDRLTLGFTWYDRRTDDALGLYCFGKEKDAYWEKSARQTIMSRSSVISNKGYELELGAEVFRTQNLYWRIAANASYNVNQLYDVHGSDVEGLNVNASTVTNRNILGMQAGALYGYIYRNGKLTDMTGDGRITGNDRCIIGSPVPLYYGGLSSSFRYRDFTFDFAFDGAAGHDILNLNRMYADEDSLNEVSDKYVERGDFLRLSEVSFSYRIPLKVKWIQSFEVSLSGHNLYTLTGYSGWNPDVNAFGASPMSAGLDYGTWPMTRSFILGVSVEF